MVDARLAGRLACERDHSAAGARRTGSLDPPVRRADHDRSDCSSIGALTDRDGRPARRAACRLGLNILISGGTGSGKTTLLNALSSFIPASERIVTIEDAAELRLQQEHVVRLETRPPNAEGRGEVLARDLVKNALAYAPRPHHRRRGARHRGARHAPGDEHRSRGIADDGSRELAARRHGAYRDDDPVRRNEPARTRRCASRSRRRST